MAKAFDKLPDELLVRITNLLTRKELLRARLACRALDRGTHDAFISLHARKQLCPGSGDREHRILKTLQGSKELSGRVLEVYKLFSKDNHTSQDDLDRFANIVKLLPNVQTLTIMLLDLLAGVNVVDTLSVSLKTLNHLTVLKLSSISMPSAGWQALLSSTPHLEFLSLSSCVSAGGWTQGLVEIVKLSKLTKLEISCLWVEGEVTKPVRRSQRLKSAKQDRATRSALNLCGETYLMDWSDATDNGGTARKTFRAEGKIQQYSINTGRTSFFNGHVGVKAGIRSILQHYMDAADLDELCQVDVNGKAVSP